MGVYPAATFNEACATFNEACGHFSPIDFTSIYSKHVYNLNFF